MAQATDTRDLLGSDLREVIEELEELDELRHMDGADWNLEIGAITEMLALRDGPSLLFDNIKGYPAGYRVLSNLMNSPRRVGLFFGLSQNANGVTLIETIRRRFSGFELFDPVEAPRGQFAEETQRGDDVDLLKFPSPFWHELDGGRYLGTACVVITKDPDGGWVNVGTYRTQVHDRRTLGLFIEPSHQGALILQRYWERGEDGPIAVCIGVQPVVLMSGFLALPWGTSEYRWASGLIGRPIEIVQGEVTGLPLP